MKTILLTALLSLAPATSYSMPQGNHINLVHALCSEEADVGGTIMTYRQNGVDIVTVLDKINANNAPANRARANILRFYGWIIFSKEEDKQQAISEARRIAYLECVKGR